MLTHKFRLIAVMMIGSLLFAPTAEAGRGHCHGGGGGHAAVAFAVGAVAGALFAPPPPPRVIHHHNFGPPRVRYEYHYTPPVVHREYHYVNPPAYAPPAVSTPTPSYRPVATPDPSFAQPARPQTNVVSAPTAGTLVDRLPVDARSEIRSGVTYYVSSGTYYLPVQVGNDNKFVVVQPN